MPSFDITSKRSIARFLFVARTRDVIDNATYLGLTGLLDELTTPRPQRVVSSRGVAVASDRGLDTAHEATRSSEPTPIHPPPSRPEPPAVSTPPVERRIATARRRIRERAPDRSIIAIISRGWSKLVGDVLANVLLYIGVILSGVAIFSFFAFGHFGRVVTNPDVRPLVFVMVPLVFAGMTRLLRQQVSVQASADATGVIGALTLPIMLSGLFRDGSNLFVPDISGSARWALYALVGVICVAVYLWLARGRRVYGYLVAPMLWASVGALGLYVTFGVSSYQLYVVLAAMALSTLFVAKHPASGIAVATGRVAVVAFPVMLLTAVVFAFRGGDDPFGPSPAVAAAVTGAMLLALSLLDDVWSDLHVRSRAVLRSGLVNAGYISLGLSCLLTVSWLASPEWIGPVAIAYGVFVWMIHDRVGGSAVWIPRVALGTIAIGGALSMMFTAPSVVVLIAVNVVAVVYLLSESVAEHVRRCAVFGTNPEWLTGGAAWAPVALGVAGFSRLEYPLSGWMLVVVGVTSVATRWLSGRGSQLSPMSVYPGLMLAVSALVVTLGDGAAYLGDPGHTMLLVGVTVVAAASASPWWARGWVVLAAGTIAFAAEVSGPYRVEATSLVAAVVAFGLLAAAQTTWFRRETLANAVYGVIGLVVAVAVSLASPVWGVTFGIAVVAAFAFLVQAALSEYGDLCWVTDARSTLPSLRRVFDAVPTALASVFWLIVLVVSAANTDASEAIAAASIGWALVIAALAFIGRADRFTSRASVYGFSLVGIGFGTAGTNGWVTMMVTAIAVGVLFLMEQRSFDLHLVLASLGGAVMWLVAEQVDGEAAFLATSLYGAAIVSGVSVWALAWASRTITAVRRPFLVFGSVTMFTGATVIVLDALARYIGGPLQTATPGLAVLVVTAASAFAGYVFRYHWMGLVVAVALPFGYVLTAWTLTAEPLDPAFMAPMVGVLVLAGLSLPDRRVVGPLASPASAMMFGAILTATASVIAAAGSVTAPWSFVLIATVVGVARFFWGVTPLRYLSALLWVTAGAQFSPEVLLVVMLVAIPVTVRWEVLASGFEAVVLRWTTALLVMMSFDIVVDVFGLQPGVVAATALGTGVIAVTVATIVATTQIAPSTARWWPQLSTLGRIGMLTGAVVFGSISETAALFSLASWTATEAGISARYAVIRVSRALAWVASTLGVVSGLFVASAAGAPLLPTAFVWWFIGLAGLVAWTTVVRRSLGTIWNGSLGFYAHGAVALSATVIAVESGTPMLVRAISTASIVALGYTWMAVAQVTRRRIVAAAGSVALAAAWCVGVGSTGDVASNLWRWTPVFVVASVAWRLLSRSSNDRHTMWAWSSGVTGITMFVVLMVSAFEPGDRTSWMRGAIVALGGAIATYRSARLPGVRFDGSAASRGLVVISTWLLAGWYLPDDFASAVLLVGVSVAGTVIAVLTATRSTVTSQGTWMWMGVHAGAVIPALAVFGWPDALTVFAVVAAAASMVSHGVLGGHRRLTMAGVEAFIGIGAALLIDGGSVTAVGAAFFGSAAILIATETERLIADARDRRPATWIQIIEWIGLLAVPATTILAGLESLTYLPALAAYGTATLVWSIITQVRRRVFVGALSILAVIVLAVATPIAQAAAVGMATAGGVGVTFVVGIVVIGIAILLERYHDTLGVKLSRMSDAMADWE